MPTPSKAAAMLQGKSKRNLWGQSSSSTEKHYDVDSYWPAAAGKCGLYNFQKGLVINFNFSIRLLRLLCCIKSTDSSLFPLLPHIPVSLTLHSCSLKIQVVRNHFTFISEHLFKCYTCLECAFQWQLYVLTDEDCHLGEFKSNSLPRSAPCIFKVFLGHFMPTPVRGGMVELPFLSDLQHLLPFPLRPEGGRYPWRARSRLCVPMDLPKVKRLKQSLGAGLLPLWTPGRRDLWQHSRVSEWR